MKATSTVYINYIPIHVHINDIFTCIYIYIYSSIISFKFCYVFEPYFSILITYSVLSHVARKKFPFQCPLVLKESSKKINLKQKYEILKLYDPQNYKPRARPLDCLGRTKKLIGVGYPSDCDVS